MYNKDYEYSTLNETLNEKFGNYDNMEFIDDDGDISDEELNEYFKNN